MTGSGVVRLTDTEREALEAACLEGLIETPHGWKYRPSRGADAVLPLIADVVAARVAAALNEAAEQEHNECAALMESAAQRIKAALALHHPRRREAWPEGEQYDRCAHCGQSMPCATRRALVPADPTP